MAMEGSLKIAAAAALVVWGAADARAQDPGWEIWPDASRWPLEEWDWGDGMGCLPWVHPDLPCAPGQVAEADSFAYFVDLHQTREKDGLTYKALQFYQDYTFDVTVQAGRWLVAPLGWGWPLGTLDALGMYYSAVNVVSIEIDGTVFPIDRSTFVDFGEYFPGAHVVGVPYYPRFTTLGQHTFSMTFEPLEPYYCVYPYELEGVEDPSPEFEGRRVFLPEVVGDPVDGKIVLQWNVTVVEGPTVVEPCSWAGAKSGRQE